MGTGKAALFGLIGLAASAGMALGQATASNLFNPLNFSAAGVHLYGVTVYSGYYPPGAQFGTGSGASSSAATNTVAGAAATFGWNRSGERSSLSATYSPSYARYFSQSGLDNWNHEAAVYWNRRLGAKWGISISGAGVVSDLQQLLFGSTAFGNIVSTPITFDDLAAVVSAGKYNNSQIASMLAGVEVFGSPERAFMYGNRILSASLQMGISWAPSQRSSFHLSASGSRAQGLDSASDLARDPVRRVPVPPTSGAGVSLGWSYALSPRTQISADVNSTRTFSRLQAGYATSGSIALARRMTEHWFVQVRSGPGYVTYSQRAVAVFPTLNVIFGGSLGYSTRSHTLLAACDRSAGDVYGLGSTSTTAASGAWNWRRPGSGWSTLVEFGWQQLSRSGTGNPNSWRAHLSAIRRSATSP